MCFTLQIKRIMKNIKRNNLKTIYKIGLILYLALTINGVAKAQSNEITISGTILCGDSIIGPLAFVNIYNKNTKKGTVSDTDGKFSIKMGRHDTILFSTVQHVEQSYYVKKNEFFHDKTIEISMKQDTVWLDVVLVMGAKKFKDFEQEVIQLKLPNNDISLVLPVINKYAKQYYLGEGALSLNKPLIYLSKKILSIGKRKIE